MKVIKELYHICKRDGAIGGWICFVVAIILILTSFFTPPMWVIDGSVIAATGELFAFATLFKLPNIIQSIKDGKSVTLRKGETEISVSSEKD